MSQGAQCMEHRRTELCEGQWDGGSFPSTKQQPCLCRGGQHNAGSISGNQPDCLTFAKWELIHFVNVLFCTASCSSVNQSPERHYHSHAMLNKDGNKHNRLIVYCLIVESSGSAEPDGDLYQLWYYYFPLTVSEQPHQTLHWCDKRRNLTFKDGISTCFLRGQKIPLSEMPFKW